MIGGRKRKGQKILLNSKDKERYIHREGEGETKIIYLGIFLNGSQQSSNYI